MIAARIANSHSPILLWTTRDLIPTQCWCFSVAAWLKAWYTEHDTALVPPRLVYARLHHTVPCWPPPILPDTITITPASRQCPRHIINVRKLLSLIPILTTIPDALSPEIGAIRGMSTIMGFTRMGGHPGGALTNDCLSTRLEVSFRAWIHT